MPCLKSMLRSNSLVPEGILCDFHLHSCLSPCGSLLMSPTRIAAELAKHHVGLAALTDHNTSLNCPAFKTACEQRGIIPLFGMELQTQEEVHVLCLFGSLKTALAFSAEIDALLPRYPYDPTKLGDQVYVDAAENILGTVKHYLRVSADIGLDAAASRVHDLGGLVIPAHADRRSFSLLSQFGYIDASNESPWDAIEVVDTDTAVVQSLRERTTKPLTRSSDAHFPEDIAQRCTILDPAESLLTSNGVADIAAIKRALQSHSIAIPRRSIPRNQVSWRLAN